MMSIESYRSQSVLYVVSVRGCLCTEDASTKRQINTRPSKRDEQTNGGGGGTSDSDAYRKESSESESDSENESELPESESDWSPKVEECLGFGSRRTALRCFLYVRQW